MAKLMLKTKEEGEAPCGEGTSSKYPESKIDEKPDIRNPERPNWNEGKNKVKNIVSLKSNQQKAAPPSKKNNFRIYSE